MHRPVNSYIAILLITAVGAAATFAILHVANSTTLYSYSDLNPLGQTSGAASGLN